MSKIIINNTASLINLDMGISIPASSQIILATQDYDEAADSDDLVLKIGNGDITINDGSTNLTSSDGIRLIQGGYTNKVQVDNDLLTVGDRIKIDVTGSLNTTNGKVLVSSNDTIDKYLEDKITTNTNILGIQTINDGSDESLQLSINQININTSDINNNANFITSAQAPVQQSDISNFETTSQLNVRDVSNRNRNNHTGTQLSSTISDFSSQVQALETITSLSFNNSTKILSYTDESGSTTNVDLTQFLDDTNLARITSGVLNPTTGVVTFTRDDLSTFTVDFSSLNDQSFINSAISTHETTIGNHSDVDVSSSTPQLGDILTYDGSNWVPGQTSSYKDASGSIVPLMNNSTTYATYTTISMADQLQSKKYKISWSLTWSLNTTSRDFKARVFLDGTTELDLLQIEVKDTAGVGLSVQDVNTLNFLSSSTNQRIRNSGFILVDIPSGTHTLQLQWAPEQANTRAVIYKAQLTIEEWS